MALFYAADEKRLDQLARSINDNSGFATCDTVEGLAADKGQGFVLSYYSSTLIPGSTQAIQIKTSTSVTVAIKEETVFASDGTLKLEFYEDPTAMTSGTTSISINNRQRRMYLDDPITYAAATVAYSDPSVISGGTLLRTKYWPGGSPVAPSNVANTEGVGWQLGKAHNYVYKFINLDVSSTISWVLNLTIYELPATRE